LHVLDHLCRYPANDTLRLHVFDDDGDQSASNLECGNPEAELAEWQDPKDR
jgi:hypothetical protein